MLVRRTDGWLTASLGDELVMMNANNRHYIELSEIGARIWELIATPQPIDTICDRLGREFDVSPATCRAEVRSFVNELVKHGVVTLDPPSAA
ncbi:MAG: PqqD family peptide modification chaperone [Rhodopseudomonas sp.]|nr:PqqD family peptide modification chaperone [Rhodopseudomonas sp.]